MKTDENEKEWALEAAVAKANAIIRIEMAVVRHRLEGLSLADSAAALGCSVTTVERLRRHLQLTTGKAWRGGTPTMGRSRDMTIRIEVGP